MRLRTTRVEHISDLRVYYTSIGAVSGLKSVLGAHLDIMRDGMSCAPFGADPESRMHDRLEPTGEAKYTKDVCFHVHPIASKLSVEDSDTLSRAFATHPMPRLKHPVPILSATELARREFGRINELFIASISELAKGTSKAKQRAMLSIDEFVVALIVRASDSKNRQHKRLIAYMNKQADELIDSAMSRYEQLYNQHYGK